MRELGSVMAKEGSTVTVSPGKFHVVEANWLSQ